MFTRKLFALAILAALGFSLSAAQARDFGPRDGYHASHRVAHRDDFRHEHRARHHHRDSHRHHRHHWQR